MESNIDVVYANLVDNVIVDGKWRITRSGRTLSTFGMFGEVDVSDRFPILTTKFVSIRAMVGELLWMINGETTIEQLKYRTFGDASCPRKTIWCPDFERWSQYPEYVSSHGLSELSELGPIYGEQWSRQLSSVIEGMKRDPDGRRHLVDSWSANELVDMCLPPCHYAYQFYIDDNDIDIMYHMRSNDIFLGAPFNISSYGLLLHIIGSIVDKRPRSMKFSLGDAHLYENSIDAVRYQISRKSKPGFQLDLSSLNIKSLDDLRDMTADDFLPLFDKYEYHPHIKVDVCVG